MAKSINILTVNAGSSSIKTRLFSYDSPSLTEKASLDIEGIGQGKSQLHLSTSKQPTESRPAHVGTMTEAQEQIFKELDTLLEGQPLHAVGHRVVHGGPKLHASTEITPDIVSELETVQNYDPEHGPAAMTLIQRFTEHFADARQFACFDTGFFHDLPKVAQLLPLPRQYYDDGLRKYGFHGLSYRSILGQLKQHAYRPTSRLIVAHLGSGASLAAIKENQPVDTTMAFTPASGIPMSTRAGDIDPGVVSYLSQRYNLDVKAFDTLIHAKSGLLGMSDLSANMLTLLEAQANNQSAAEAVAVFCYQVRKAIGSLTAAMGGLDTLVFTGGIGEKSAEVRRRVVDGLEYLGIELDHQSNQENAQTISHRLSGVAVLVMATDESKVIAGDVVNLLDKE